jgi:hypothetical protein
MRRAPFPSPCAICRARQRQDRANQSNQGERTAVLRAASAARFPHAFPTAATGPDIVRSAALHWNGPTASSASSASSAPSSLSGVAGKWQMRAPVTLRPAATRPYRKPCFGPDLRTMSPRKPTEERHMAKSIEPPYEKISLRRKAAAKNSNTVQTAVPKGT